MTPIDRRVLLLRAGITQTEIAREYGCSVTLVHYNLDDKRTTPALRRLIARRLRVPVRKLFPRRLAA